MNGWIDLPFSIGRATILLSIAAGLAVLGLIWLRSRSPRWNAVCWTMVLCTGVLVFPITLEIPWYPAEAPTQTPAVEVFEEASNEPLGSDVAADGSASSLAELASPSTSSTSWSWRQWLGCLWLLGILVVASTSVAGYVWLLAALRSAWLPQRSWQQAYDLAAASMGMRRKPKLVVHAKLGPCLCWTPLGARLVVPSGRWTQLTGNQRRAVLKHELAHYRRGDLWRAIDPGAVGCFASLV